jgi:hypothetical protein
MIVCQLGGTYPYDRHVCVRWGPPGSIADVQAPSPLEIDSLTILNDDFTMTGIVGWEVDGDVIVDPNWGRFLGQRPGHTAIQEARLVFAADLAGADIRKMLWRGKAGIVVIMPSGCHRLDAPMDVYPTRVTHAKPYHRLGLGGAQIEVRFAVTSEPGVSVYAVTPVGSP